MEQKKNNGGKENKGGTVIQMQSGNLNAKVTRQEMIDIMTQVIDNINTLSQYVMDDVNVMYQNHVFPLQMRVSVLEDIIKERGISTQEDIVMRTGIKIKELQDAAEAKKKEMEAEKEAPGKDSEGDNENRPETV